MTPEPKVRSPDSPLAGARLALTLLLLINVFNYIDRYVLAAVIDNIQESFFPKGQSGAVSPALSHIQGWCQARLGFKPELALLGVLGMAFMAVYMVGAPVFGRLAERRSRWMLVGVGVILWSLASGASGLAGGFIGMLLTRCLVGVGEAAYGPVAPTLLSDLYPVKQRGQVLARFYLAIPVGTAVGYILGAWVAGSNLGPWMGQTVGIHAESWRWAFYLVVAPGLVLGICSLFMKEPRRGQADLDLGVAAEPRKVQWRDYSTLLRTPSFVLCTLGMTAMTFAMGGIAFWMPYYLKHKPSAPEHVTEIFGAIVVVAGLSGTLLGGLAGDRLRARIPGSYFLVSGIAMLVGFPFMLLTLHAAFPGTWVWVWLFVACFCLFFNTGPTNTILANVSPPSIRAAGFALNILVIHALGDVLSPVVIGILGDRYDMTFAFSVVGGTFILAAIFWFAGMRFLARDTERAPLRLQLPA